MAKLMNSGDSLDAFKFVCFRCPAGMPSHSKLRVHSESVGHRNLSKQSTNVVSCECCKRYFEDTFHLELHNLTLAHRQNFENPPTEGNIVPATERVGHCVLCNVTAESSDHISDERHGEMVEIMRRYFKKCREMSFSKMFSIPMGRRDLEAFLRAERATSAISPAARFLRRLYPKVVTGKRAKFRPPYMSLEDFNFATISDFYLNSLLRQIVTASVNPSPQAQKQPPSASSVPEGGRGKSGTITMAAAASGGGTLYSDSLDHGDIYRVTRCPKCHLKFDHATYMLVHSAHCHNADVASLLREDCRRHREQLQGKGKSVKCAKCMRTCASPLVFAIHHDQHFAPRAIACPHCALKYKSWAQYYRHDTCKRNSVPEEVKVAVEEAVNSLLSRSAGGVIGSELLEEGAVAEQDEDTNDNDGEGVDDGDEDDGEESEVGLVDSNSDGSGEDEDVDMEDAPDHMDEGETDLRESDPKLGPSLKAIVKFSKMDRHIADTAAQFRQEGRKRRRASVVEAEGSRSKFIASEVDAEEEPPKKMARPLHNVKVVIGKAEKAAAEATASAAHKISFIKKARIEDRAAPAPPPKLDKAPVSSGADRRESRPTTTATVKSESKCDKPTVMKPEASAPAKTEAKPDATAVKAIKKEISESKYSTPNRYMPKNYVCTRIHTYALYS